MLSVVVDNVVEENDLSLQTDTVLVKVSDQIFYLFFCQLQWNVSQAGVALNSVFSLSGRKKKKKKKYCDKLDPGKFCCWSSTMCCGLFTWF